MAEDAADPTLELLRRIRWEQASFRERVEHRFGGLESDMLEVKQTMRGLTSMRATVTGRLEEAEVRVTRLDGR